MNLIDFSWKKTLFRLFAILKEDYLFGQNLFVQIFKLENDLVLSFSGSPKSATFTIIHVIKDLYWCTLYSVYNESSWPSLSGFTFPGSH